MFTELAVSWESEPAYLGEWELGKKMFRQKSCVSTFLYQNNELFPKFKEEALDGC